MSHHTQREAYGAFIDRLNRFPQGTPPSDTLYQILSVLVSRDEAAQLALLPIRPFTAARAAKCLHITKAEAKKTLDHLCDKAMLLDVVKDGGETRYMMPPPMAGFMEFAMMRVRTDIDQKLLSELYHQYMLVEDEFFYDLFYSKETNMGRVFVREDAVKEDQAVHILDYERATQVIETAPYISVGLCYCRHKQAHLGLACDAPQEVCMTFGNTAEALSRHGHTRHIGKSEAMDILHLSYDHNLVQGGENVRENVSFMCNCCGCCCDAMLAAKKYGLRQPIVTTNYEPALEKTLCVDCGKCLKVCPVDAISLDAEKKPVVDENMCLGCGLCVKNCPTKALTLNRREQRLLTPVNSTHRIVLNAIETGTLQNLAFDTPDLMSHRVMGNLFGAILRLPPVKQALASKQMKSKYLARLIAGKGAEM